MDETENTLARLKAQAYDLIAKGQGFERALNEVNNNLAMINNLILEFQNKTSIAASSDPQSEIPVDATPVGATSDCPIPADAPPVQLVTDESAPVNPDLTPAPTEPAQQ